MSFLVGKGEHVANDELSFTHIVAKGPSDVIKIGSQVEYEVIGGEIKFYIGDGPDESRVETLTAGHGIIIKPGATFSSIGERAIMRATFIPPFDPSQLETIKHNEVSAVTL